MMDRAQQLMLQAFALESRNAAQNRALALRAHKEGHKSLAQGLKAVALSQEVHARRLLMLLRGKLPAGVDGVRELALSGLAEALELYNQELPKEEAAGIKPLRKSFRQFARVNQGLEKVMAQAAASPGGNDAVLWVCGVCGHVAQEHAPDQCPTCGAVPAKFREVD